MAVVSSALYIYVIYIRTVHGRRQPFVKSILGPVHSSMTGMLNLRPGRPRQAKMGRNPEVPEVPKY